jgi:predicted nucleotidyltransferase
MSRLVSSDIALRALLLLSQRDEGMRTMDVARALGASYSGAEKALDLLVEDGLVAADGPLFRLAASPRAAAAARFAVALLPAEESIGALALGNESVEFAGADADGILVVFRRFPEPAQEQRLRLAIAQVRDVYPQVCIEFAAKADLREQLLTELAPRRRAMDMTVLAGRIDRTFPDRTVHGDVDGQPLGRLNDGVQAPSTRRLRLLARRYGLRKVTAFGSATRADFRSDSDLDLLVELAPGANLRLAERVSLIVDVERLFARDVDLLTAPPRRAALAERISRDAVVLYDAAR